MVALLTVVVGIALIPHVPSAARGGSSSDDSLARAPGRTKAGREAGESFDVRTPVPRPKAVDHCATCHVEPSPDLLPKERWMTMLNYMKELMVDYDLGEMLSGDDEWEVTKYYVSNAPEKLPTLDYIDTPSPVSFTRKELGSVGEPVTAGHPPAIAQIRVGDLDQNGETDLLVCDLTADALTWLTRDEQGEWHERILASEVTPVHVEAVDLTGDSHMDLVVASIGSFEPTEAQVGSVTLLLNNGDETFEKRTILSGVPRVADVEPMDVDGDGDTDFIVAMFGGWKTGSLGWLEKKDDGDYVLHEIEAINGASHVPVVDLNGDHRPDFIALISQHHETVVAYVNIGMGQFEAHEIYAAPNPLFGSSSISLVDLDQDGDMDVLQTNGDALDNDPYPKPYHGVQWHENLGDLKFTTHRIADLYGAFGVRAADFDGDHDLDLVVVSNLNYWNDPKRPSIVYFENDGRQDFALSVVATKPIELGCVEVADLNADGRPDFLTGGLNVMPPLDRLSRVSLWTNAAPVH